MSVAQHTMWAQRNGKHELTAYIEHGGLPPVIGEWALAGNFLVLPKRHWWSCAAVLHRVSAPEDAAIAGCRACPALPCLHRSLARLMRPYQCSNMQWTDNPYLMA